MLRGLIIGGAASVALAAFGCAAQADDPLAVMLDRDRGVSVRLDAAERLGPVATAADPPRYLAALREIAWSARQPVPLRCLAIDRLIEHDEAAFRRRIDRRIVEVNSWPVLRHIFDHAQQRGWTDFTRTAIRSYARPSRVYADADRPERGLIEALHPDRPLTEVVFETFTGLDPRDTVMHQVSAWVLLSRLTDAPTRRAWLSLAPPTTPLVVDLQAAAVVVDELPAHREQLVWLASLRADGAMWRRIEQRVAALEATRRRGLALRHLPVLAALPAEALGREEAALRSSVRRGLGASRVVRTDRAPAGWTEAYEDVADRLSWADLLVMDVLLEALRRDRELVAALFAGADADHADPRSEHGGVLVLRAGTVRAEAFAPEFRVHERKFIASVAMIERLYTGLAHYHYHAQDHENGAYAGPGGGDLDFVNRFGCTAVVLTFLDRDTLNVDCHVPGGIVIDLGSIRRP